MEKRYWQTVFLLKEWSPVFLAAEIGFVEDNFSRDWAGQGEDGFRTIQEHHIYQHFNGTPLQHSCLENPMNGGVWQAAVCGVTKSRTRLSDFTFTFHFHVLEKEMATHSSVGESQGRGSLMGCLLWGCTESDTTEATQQQQHTNTTSDHQAGTRGWGPLC